MATLTASVTTGDRFAARSGRFPLSGVQALIRLIVDVRRADRAQGLDTAAFVSGYEGSPLAGLDLELQRRRSSRRRGCRRWRRGRLQLVHRREVFRAAGIGIIALAFVGLLDPAIIARLRPCRCCRGTLRRIAREHGDQARPLAREIALHRRRNAPVGNVLGRNRTAPRRGNALLGEEVGTGVVRLLLLIACERGVFVGQVRIEGGAGLRRQAARFRRVVRAGEDIAVHAAGQDDQADRRNQPCEAS